jgi:hypothetical protein
MAESNENAKNRFFKHLTRGALLFTVLLISIWALGLIFRLLYPSTTQTQHLAPFQNNFLNFTSAFTTSDTFSSISGDSGPVTRFAILSMVAGMLTLLFQWPLGWIPGLRKHLDRIGYGIFIFLVVIAFFYAVFVPGTLTVFNAGRKQLDISTIEWGVIRSQTQVPYNSITGFSMNFDKGEGGDDDGKRTIHAQLFAETSTGRILVAENCIGNFKGVTADWKPSDETQKEIDNAIAAMKQLISLVEE